MQNKPKILPFFAVLLLCCITFSGCLSYSGNILNVSVKEDQGQSITSSDLIETLQPSISQTEDVSTTMLSDFVPVTEHITEAPVPVTQPQPTSAPEPTQEQTTAQDENDPSQWTREKILEFLTTAINSTKAYSGNLTVEHSEDFSFNITKCPGGSIGVSLANTIASGVLKPKTETLQYSGGVTVDSDGKTVPILLPKRTNFSLPAAGVKTAKAYKKGNDTVIEISLVPEHGEIDKAPNYNAGAIGYLDADDLDLSLLTIKTLDVEYPGSSMVVQIDQQGRVVCASYNVPISIDATGSALIGISGSFACNGSEKEVWTLNW